jgi:hypothetical protein
MVNENGPPVESAIGNDPNPPDRMQMIENDIAKLWNVPIRRDSSWA